MTTKQQFKNSVLRQLNTVEYAQDEPYIVTDKYLDVLQVLDESEKKDFLEYLSKRRVFIGYKVLTKLGEYLNQYVQQSNYDGQEVRRMQNEMKYLRKNPTFVYKLTEEDNSLDGIEAIEYSQLNNDPITDWIDKYLVNH